MDEVIEMKTNKLVHLKLCYWTSYDWHPEIVTLDKQIQVRYTDEKIRGPKFQTLCDLYMGLTNPESGKPLIQGIVAHPSRPGVAQIMYFDVNNNGDYIKKIKKHTAAFWWHYMIASGMKEGCYKSFMDCFEMMHRLVAHQSEWDPATWAVTSNVIKERSDFAAGVEEALSDLSDVEDNEVARQPITGFSEEARKDLFTTLKDNEDLEDMNLNATDKVSLATGASSTGGSTHQSGGGSQRRAATAELNKQLSKKATELETEKDDLQKKNDALEARLRALEALISGAPQGAQHNIGSAAAGKAPLDQDTDSDGRAAAGG